ncbi:MAG: ATP-binding protein, partial [Acidobacteriota bacterium]
KMKVNRNSRTLEPEESRDLSIRVAEAFHPRAPISAKELFAGRRQQITVIADAVSQTGLHLVIFGERGVGKTSLANVIEPFLNVAGKTISARMLECRLVVKVNTHQRGSFESIWRRAFDEVSWSEDGPTTAFGPIVVAETITLRKRFNIPDEPSIDDVRRLLAVLPRSVFIFDEFDRSPAGAGQQMTDLIKALSDYAVNSSVVLVGVSSTIDALVCDHASIVRSIVQVHLPRMTERALKNILDRAAAVLDVEFTDDASRLIVRMSQGLPHYTHLIGLNATRRAVERFSRRIEVTDVQHSFEMTGQQIPQSGAVSEPPREFCKPNQRTPAAMTEASTTR